MILECSEPARLGNPPDERPAEVTWEDREKVHLLGLVAVDLAPGVLVQLDGVLKLRDALPELLHRSDQLVDGDLHLPA